MSDSVNRSKLKLSYEMLIFLYSQNSLVKAKDLSVKFNLSNRSIRRVISDLRDLGYEIISSSGPYGGYRLDRANIILPVSISSMQKQAWLDIENTVRGSDLINKDKALELLDIIGIQSQLSSPMYTEIYSTKKLLDSVKNNIETTYLTLTKAIKTKQRVEIKYKSLKKSQDDLVWQEFRPERFQVFNGIIYIKGYYDTKNSSFRTLRLSRFDSIRLIDKKYSFNEEFETDNQKSAFSQNVYKLYNVKLKIIKASHDLLDYNYGENQTIKEYDDYHILSFDLAGDLLIKELVLSMGTYVEIIQPKTIRKEIINDLNIMQSKYLNK